MRHNLALDHDTWYCTRCRVVFEEGMTAEELMTLPCPGGLSRTPSLLANPDGSFSYGDAPYEDRLSKGTRLIDRWMQERDSNL